MKKKKGLSSINRHRENPFIVELKGRMFLQPRANAIIARGEKIIDVETGEIIKEDSVLIGRQKIVDKSQFAKIYASELGTLFELSKAGINVFLYLSKIMDYDNKAYFNYTQEYEELGYKSLKTCYRGLLELISKNIIAPCYMTNFWWLNPALICKGERFAKYTEYVIGKDDENIRNYVDAEKKIKGKIIGELQPEQVREKYQKANYQTPIDSKNNKLNFEDDN